MSVTRWGVDEFDAFVAETHAGRKPFPWQRDLVASILETGAWPEILDVPTGLGKTSVLDAAVFTAAASPATAPRRVFFVVDRRIIVDEAHNHASALAGALSTHTGPVTARVAAALAQPGDEPGSALTATKMRGGATWERWWTQRPDRFCIVTGTVDQIGSRLLFRGYGLPETGRSIDAALTGTDSLIIIDEAHLAEPFLATVRSAFAQDPAEKPLRSVPRVVSMTATHHALTTATTHRWSHTDEQHPVAGRRLHAPKTMHLVEVPTGKSRADANVAAAIADITTGMAQDHGVTLVVANTVARARAIFETVRQTSDIESVLLTGRSRSIDRELLMQRYYPRITAGRDRENTKPLIVVATQTVEVGANIDADALVSESAAWSSVTQRLGRLNRLGDLSAALAVIVHDASVDAKDWIYGPSRLATWTWLAGLAEVHMYQKKQPLDLASAVGLDAAPLALRALGQTAPAEVRPPQVYTPVLFPATLRSWAQTSPTPHPDTPVAPYLHGISNSSTAVSVVWRSALRPGDEQQWRWLVGDITPNGEESIEVPVAAVRAWLSGSEPSGPLSDLDTPAEEVPDEPAEVSGPSRQALLYDAEGEHVLVEPERIRPGTTIIVPAVYGGCDEYGWNPADSTPVVDVADLAHHLHDSAMLRLGPTLDAIERTYPDLSTTFTTYAGRLKALAQRDRAAGKPSSGYSDLLGELTQHAPPEDTPLGRTVRRLAMASKLQATVWRPVYEDLAGDIENDAGPWDVLLSTRHATFADDINTAASSASSKPITLGAHQEAVALRAAEFARNLDLPENLVAAVETAARLHDEGKRDLRFQAMLHGGDRLRAEVAPEPLAKSGMNPTDRAAFRRARIRAGYPAGLRHEELSHRIAERLLPADTPDRDLILHLIATHHGHARPLLPTTPDPSPIPVDAGSAGVLPSHEPIDWRNPDRFEALTAEYGHWGLALLETIVRAADVWASIRNDEEPPQPVVTARAAVEGPPEHGHAVELPALDGRTALGFLAALGVTRLLDARLSFSETTGAAILHSPYGDTREITEALRAIVTAIPDGALLPGAPTRFPLMKQGSGKDPMRTARENFQAYAASLETEPAALAWISSVLTDLALDRNGRTEITPYTAPRGQQSIGTFFATPLAAVRDKPEHLHDALTHWQRIPNFTGEYLDHHVINSAADDPSGRSTEYGVPGATWLATQALPLLRVTGTGTRVQATGWHQPDPRKAPYLIWPLWHAPLTPTAIRTLLEHPALQSITAKPLAVAGLQPLLELGVFHLSAAHRQRIEGAKFAGVLAPVAIHTSSKKTAPISATIL